MSLKLTVKGMHCNSCKMLIEEELEDLGAQDINITFDAATQIGHVTCELDDEQAAIDTISELGEYEVTRE